MVAGHFLPLLIALAAMDVSLGGQKPKLLQTPCISQTHIAFIFADDLWIVSRDGGDARRLTTGAFAEAPVFSPDGAEIAFYATYDDDWGDIYLIDSTGGTPRRVTWKPGWQWPVAWMPDGKSLWFVSGEDANRLYSIPREGGPEKELPIPVAVTGSLSPDGRHIAYMPHRNRLPTWKGYRGGGTSSIWIADLKDLRVEKIPRDNSNDFNPMWVGDLIYFLSDRSGSATLFAYDLAKRQVTEVIPRTGWDIESASFSPGAIAYVQGGFLFVYNLQEGLSRKVELRITADFPGRSPRFVRAASRIAAAGLSPKGEQVLFEARGEVLVVQAGNSRSRNLTNTPGVREIFPTWSPDGKRIAYFSDESGEYALHVRNEDETGAVRKIPLGDLPSFYFSPVWSPDSSKIAYGDKRLNLWYVDVDTERLVRVDTDSYQERLWVRVQAPPPSWSPDSRWLAYSKLLKNWLRAVFVFSIETGRTHQVTDGRVDVRFPQFDASGIYLFFASSKDSGLISSEETSGIGRLPSRNLHLAVLRKGLPSPLRPADSKTEAAAATLPAPHDVPRTVRIDFENLEDRIITLPLPARNYTAIVAGKAGILYTLESNTPDASGMPAGRSPSREPLMLRRFELATGKTETLGEGLQHFTLSRNGEMMLCRRGDTWTLLPSTAAVRPDDGTLDLGSMQIRIDPMAEWRQMFDEVWRFERDFFYDPGHHGLNLEAAKRKYEPFLEQIVSRSQLSELFRSMLSELRVSHILASVGGSDDPWVDRPMGGLLGADYEILDGRYRFKQILRGDPWMPGVRAPLAQPGVEVRVGEYLLAVNGVELSGSADIYRAFEGMANKPAVIRVGANPSGIASRELTVTPVSIQGERVLRRLAQVEENRRKVDAMTGGRVAYVAVPDTVANGHTMFIQQYTAQQDKEAVIIDERSNGGGRLADSIVQRLSPAAFAFIATRDGNDAVVPFATIRGPKVMLIDEEASSGGDALAHLFRRAGLGPLVGKRTAGALVGVGGILSLLDGNFVSAPNNAIYDPDGKWVAENEGVAPDIEVEQDPAAVRSGRDPQLEKAVEVIMDLLNRDPLPAIKRPPYKKIRYGIDG